jgi:hypothetical protein
VKEDELNYFDELKQVLAEAVAEGRPLGEAMALRTWIQTAFDNVTLTELLGLLEKKAVITQDDRTELKASIGKTVNQQMKAAADKNPAFAEGMAKWDKEHYEEGDKPSLIFLTHIWKYVDLDRMSEDEKADARK